MLEIVANTQHNNNNNNILKNIQDYLRINCPITWAAADARNTTHKPSIDETAKYQLQITIPDQHTFDMIRAKLFLLIEREVKKQISPNEWQIHIPPEVSQWHHFGQKSGRYSIFNPPEFNEPGDYRICHLICERLLVQPAVMCRSVIQTVINTLGDLVGASNPGPNSRHSKHLNYTLRKKINNHNIRTLKITNKIT